MKPEMTEEPVIKEREYRVISPIPEPVMSSASYWDVASMAGAIVKTRDSMPSIWRKSEEMKPPPQASKAKEVNDWTPKPVDLSKIDQKLRSSSSSFLANQNKNKKKAVLIMKESAIMTQHKLEKQP